MVHTAGNKQCTDTTEAYFTVCFYCAYLLVSCQCLSVPNIVYAFSGSERGLNASNAIATERPEPLGTAFSYQCFRLCENHSENHCQVVKHREIENNRHDFLRPDYDGVVIRALSINTNIQVISNCYTGPRPLEPI